MPKKKYTKQDIKIDYIVNKMNVKELANKYNLKERTIQKYISSEKWKNEKENYYKSIADDVLKQTKQELINELSEYEKKHIKNITKTIDILTEIINDENQFYRYNTSPIERTLGKKEYISEKADLQSIKGYISSLKDLQTLLNDILEKDNIENNIQINIVGVQDEVEKYAE